MEFQTPIVSMDELLKRQQAMDAYQKRLNETQKMEMRKSKEALDQAKIGQTNANIFKTQVATQKTIVDAQRALQQIQQQKTAGVTASSMPGTEGLTVKPFKRQYLVKKQLIPGLTEITQEKAKETLSKKGSWLTDALKMENRLGWALMPGLAGAGIGGGIGALYSGGDKKYMLGDIAAGAGIGGGLGAALGHNYGAKKLKNLLGGNLGNEKAFSLKALKKDNVAKIIAARFIPPPIVPSPHQYLSEYERTMQTLNDLSIPIGKGGTLKYSLAPDEAHVVKTKLITEFNAKWAGSGLPLIS